jgi:hypothetical protein
LNVVQIIIAGPPTDHSIRRRRARTLAVAARVKNPGDFGCAERAIEDFHLINQTIHDVRGADVATNEQVCCSGKRRSYAGSLRGDLDAININLPIAVIERSGHVVP